MQGGAMNVTRYGASLSIEGFRQHQDGQRMPYNFPQIQVLKLESVVRNTGSTTGDGLGTKRN